MREPVHDHLELLSLDARTDRYEEQGVGAELRVLERVGRLLELRALVTPEDQRERLARARERLGGDERDHQPVRAGPSDPERVADEPPVRREAEVARAVDGAVLLRSGG